MVAAWAVVAALIGWCVWLDVGRTRRARAAREAEAWRRREVRHGRQ